MAIEIKMPQLGESVHEGMIGKWLKKPGESVAKYEPLLEVVTDKVDTEVTAVEGGTLLQILVPEGETVGVGTVLALLGEEGEEVAAAAAPAAEAKAAAATPAEASAAPGEAKVSPVAARVAAEHGVDPAAVPGSGPGGRVGRADVERFVAEGGAAAPAGEPRKAVGFVSPRVARLAAEHGVDLRAVAGTGLDGRITARDVEAYLEGRAAEPAAPAAPAPAAPAAPAAAGPSVTPGEVVELSNMRRAIADHMVRSKQVSPHVTTVHEVDMSAVVAAYKALKAPYADRGVKLTYTAFIVRAVAEALAEHPMVNSSWADGGVQLHPDVNIGLAVAIPAGLIVPVLRNANEKSLLGIAREVTDLATRARDKKLLPDDVQGGTFTITNYGTLGSLIGTPVINQPQAAILGTGAIRKQVVVVEGPEGDSIGIRPMMFLSLTFDHRILDGGTADPFVQTVVAKLQAVTT